MPLGMEVGLDRDDIGRWGPSYLLLEKGAEPKFSVHVYREQTAGSIKMPLGTMVGLGLATLS